MFCPGEAWLPCPGFRIPEPSPRKSAQPASSHSVLMKTTLGLGKLGQRGDLRVVTGRVLWMGDIGLSSGSGYEKGRATVSTWHGGRRDRALPRKLPRQWCSRRLRHREGRSRGSLGRRPSPSLTPYTPPVKCSSLMPLLQLLSLGFPRTQPGICPAKLALCKHLRELLAQRKAPHPNGLLLSP